MKLTKERKIYVALLAVGLGALTLDRAFSSSEASETPENPSELLLKKSDSSAAAKSSAGVPESRDDSSAIISRLTSLDENERLYASQATDAFQLPARWAAACQNTQAQARLTPVEEFERTHRLNAVMVAGPRSKAIVDGQTIAVGQSMDGFKLVEVTQRLAVLESKSGQVVLRIMRQSNLNPAGGAQ